MIEKVLRHDDIIRCQILWFLKLKNEKSFAFCFISFNVKAVIGAIFEKFRHNCITSPSGRTGRSNLPLYIFFKNKFSGLSTP